MSHFLPIAGGMIALDFFKCRAAPRFQVARKRAFRRRLESAAVPHLSFALKYPSFFFAIC
jgi:hypothetical protein